MKMVVNSVVWYLLGLLHGAIVMACAKMSGTKDDDDAQERALSEYGKAEQSKKAVLSCEGDDANE